MSKIQNKNHAVPPLSPTEPAAPVEAPVKSTKAEDLSTHKSAFEVNKNNALESPSNASVNKPPSVQRSIPTKNVAETETASHVSEAPATSKKVTTDPVQREAIMNGLEGLENASAFKDTEFKDPTKEGVIWGRNDKTAGDWKDLYSNVGNQDAARDLDAALIRPNGDPVTDGDIDKAVEEYAAAREKDPKDGFGGWSSDQKAEWKKGASDFLKARRDSNSVLTRRHSKPEGLPSLPYNRGEFNKPASEEEKAAVREKLDTWKAKEKAAIRKEARANNIPEDSISVKTKLGEVDYAAETYYDVYTGDRDYVEDQNGPNIRKIYRDELESTGGDVIAAHRKAAIYQRSHIAKKGTDIGAHN